MKEFWKSLPPIVRTIATIVGIALLLLLLWRGWNFAKAALNKNKSKGQLAAHQAAGETQTYTDAEYNAMASAIYTAMKGPGTDEEAAYAVLNKLKNNVDFLKLQTAFGIRDTYDLNAWVQGDFNTSEIAQINNLLANKGITYTF